MNKGILIMGSPASGKTQFEKEIVETGMLDGFQFWDQDIWVENPNSDYYNNPLKASNHLYKTVLPDIMSRGNNFVLNTVGSNTNTLRKIIDYKQYQWKVVIVYCNPIIAFKRNFSRDRKLPKQVVLERWLQVYSQIDEYINMFGKDNIYIYETEYTKEEQHLVDIFESGNTTVEYELQDIQVGSSFRTDTTSYTVEQILEKENKFKLLLGEIDSKINNIEDKIGYSPLCYPKEKILQEIAEWKN